VQTFLPTPMAMATAMYHGRKNPLHKISADSEAVETVRAGKIRRLHKAFLRYHDPDNWPILREALKRMGRSDLIGNSDRHLVPRYDTPGTVSPAKEMRNAVVRNHAPANRGQRKQPFKMAIKAGRK
jgi:hypothetical protein